MNDRLARPQDTAEAEGQGDQPILRVVGSVDWATQRCSKESRVATWQEMIGAQSLDDFYDALNYLGRYFGRVQVSGRLFTVNEATAVMNELLTLRTVMEALEARRLMIKDGTFDHIELTLADKGVDDPKNTNGQLLVQSTGKKFCKEGAGIGPSVLDWDVVEDQLTEEDWEEIQVTEIIKTPDKDRLADLVTRKPELATVIRDALSPGEPKTPRFQVRDIGEKDEDDDD
jgi:hypothetical protein